MGHYFEYIERLEEETNEQPDELRQIQNGEIIYARKVA